MNILMTRGFYDDPKTFGTIHDAIAPIMPIRHHCPHYQIARLKNSNQKVVKPLCPQFSLEPLGPDESQTF